MLNGGDAQAQQVIDSPALECNALDPEIQACFRGVQRRVAAGEVCLDGAAGLSSRCLGGVAYAYCCRFASVMCICLHIDLYVYA